MRDYPPGRYEIVSGYKVDRCTIPDYFTDYFWHNAQTWSICEKYGLPYAGGWAQHSSVLIKMLQVFDLAKSKIEREQAEEKNKSSGRRIRK